ncbi:LysR family transcriptional regulator substrate-binding protein, partial [Escherichia coli]|nr:LysR family transcriptional regulator substrate-binding protein [Escherichia coli]
SAQKTEPAIDVRFVEGNGDDIADQVARGTINVAFIQERVNKASIVSEHCWNETIVVALPEGHRLAGHHALRREALRCETFL